MFSYHEALALVQYMDAVNEQYLTIVQHLVTFMKDRYGDGLLVHRFEVYAVWLWQTTRNNLGDLIRVPSRFGDGAAFDRAVVRAVTDFANRKDSAPT